MHDPGVCSECWFLRRVMRLLVRKFRDVVLLGRRIPKGKLYPCFSWWFRMDRNDAKHILRLLVRTFEGVQFSNHGLRIPKEYLPSRGGDSGGVDA